MSPARRALPVAADSALGELPGAKSSWLARSASRISRRLFARAAGGADGDVQLARPGSAGEWLRRDSEFPCEADCNSLARAREVHSRLRIREAVGPGDLFDAVAEGADAACDLACVVDVTAAVQHADLDPPRRRQDCAELGAAALAAGTRHDQQRGEDCEGDQDRA